MDVVLRAVALYAFLLVLFRTAGKRALAQTTVFDLVLLFVISEMAGPMVLGGDQSFSGGGAAIATLVLVDVAFSLAKQRSSFLDRFVDGVAIYLMREGRLDREAMERERVAEDDILAAARQHQGIDSLDRVDDAVLERSGQISVIPR
ncbi:MAG TPA: YetF domain-containing protein [Myxococcota bacterium]|jgi:uncharacterized membrane protein YcaP (DUF421 family)|nr:YetF domain-containing protein [Myxococcota bacterium]